MSLSGPNGVGHRRRQGPEECRALTLPMPHAVYGAPLQLTVLEDEFQVVATPGRVAPGAQGWKIRRHATLVASACDIDRRANSRQGG